MDTYSLVALLLAIAAALVVGELLLPTHGLLAVAGGAAAVIGIVVCAKQNPWVALGLAVGMAAATPLVGALWLRVWPRTPVGRRILLPNTVSPPPEAPPVFVGQTAVTVSELRPMGVCELEDGTRVEALSEHGIVPAGTAVRVIAIGNNRPTVRVVT